MVESAKHIAFQLTLVQSAGPLFQVGSPQLFLWLNVAHGPGTPIDDGKVFVICYDEAARAWREHTRSMAVEQSREVIERLKKLGFPVRRPDVEGVVDTSGGWSHLSFQGRIDESNFVFNIGMESSGFRGRDAEQLRELFRCLFRLAGYAGYDPTIYGRNISD
jgi:hypothetical protein